MSNVQLSILFAVDGNNLIVFVSVSIDTARLADRKLRDLLRFLLTALICLGLGDQLQIHEDGVAGALIVQV